jgi:predicted cupin superfamily sugar epimerase
MSKPQEFIEKLGLSPHPEGGYFREVYRASEIIPKEALPQRFSGDRHMATSIYYLLCQGQRSRLHRIHSDETWHFYAGDPLQVVMVSPEGDVSEVLLGSDLAKGQVFQYTVPAGLWFGACLPAGSQFSLVGCTVAPGFDFQDFSFADHALLDAIDCKARELIEKLM